MSRKKLRVAACQIRFGEDIEENAARIVERLKDCAAQRVDVVAFQEGALFGYSCRVDFWETLDPERLVKAERKIVLACKWVGIAAVVGTSHLENGVRDNSLLVVDRDGSGAVREDPPGGRKVVRSGAAPADLPALRGGAVLLSVTMCGIPN